MQEEKRIKKKNIIFILADQLRADYCSCYGADWLNTPNIDNLANEGVRYVQAVTPSPACVPARASLMTGCSALENRVLDNFKWLRPDRKKMGMYTWPEELADEGYHTAAIGKMHFYPWDAREGFKYRKISEDKRHIDIQDDYTMFLKKHGYKRLHGSAFVGYYENKGAVVSDIPEEYQIDRWVCHEACEYINTRDDDNPFAMMVGFPGPHGPYDPTQEMLDSLEDVRIPQSISGTRDSRQFIKRNHLENSYPWNGVDLTSFTEKEKQKVRKHYSALVQAIDEHVGTIIQCLKDNNLYEDTVIIFTSDHGDYLGDYDMAGKGHYYESATRIPLIITDGSNKGIIEHVVSLTDVHHTILNFGGVEVEDTNDSVVLEPFGKTSKRVPVLGCNDMGWMIRGSRFMITTYYNGVREFYDLENDPTQQNNLINDSSYQEQILEYQSLLQERVFHGINKGNMDNQAKVDNYGRKGNSNRFDFEGWERPYPYKVYH